MYKINRKEFALTEIWKDIEGYNYYKVSNLGRVISYGQDTVNGKIKYGNKTKKGYLTLKLYDGNGNSKWFPVHRLVANAFIPNPDNLPQVNHKDENKENNCVDNLEWCENEYNANYGTRNERTALANRCCETTSVKVYSIDSDGNREEFESIGEAERITGLSHSNIVRTLKGRSHTCGGRQWFYC